jgi:internalin A
VIEEHLERADLGILLISADFLASDYIADIEMPRLQSGSKSLLPLVVGECDHRDITNHRFAPWGLAPLRDMNLSQRDSIYTQVASAVRALLERPPGSSESK